MDGTIVNIAAPVIRGDLGGGSSVLERVVGCLHAVLLRPTGHRRPAGRHLRPATHVPGRGRVVHSVLPRLRPRPDLGPAGRSARPARHGCRGADPATYSASSNQVFPPDKVNQVFTAFGPVLGLSAVARRSSAACWSAPTCSAGAGGDLPGQRSGRPRSHGQVPQSSCPRQRHPRRFPARLRRHPAQCRGRDRRCVPPGAGPRVRLAGMVLADHGRRTGRVRRVCLVRKHRSGQHLVEPSLLRNRSLQESGLVVAMSFFAAMTGHALASRSTSSSGRPSPPSRPASPWRRCRWDRAVGAVAFGLVAKLGRLTAAHRRRRPLVGLAVLGLTVAARGSHTGPWSIAPGLLIAGLGMGFVSPAFSTSCSLA